MNEQLDVVDIAMHHYALLCYLNLLCLSLLERHL